jgi:hypothetical protein
MLSGCFATDHPLIDPASADTPFVDGVHLAELTNCDSGIAGQLLSCKGYRQTDTDTLQVQDGTYEFRGTSSADAMISRVAPGSKGPVRLTFKQIGPELFVIQMPAPGDGKHWIYAMMRRDGNSAYVYFLQCEQNGDATYVRSGALTAITQEMMMPTCVPASLASLGKIMADRIANGIPPDKRYDIVKDK